MNLSEFCAGIALAPEAAQQLQRLPISEADYHSLRCLFHADPERFYREVKKREQFRLLFLYCFCRMACEIHEIYQKKKIPEQIYWDTFYDLTLWCENCNQMFGEYGIAQYDWFFRHLELTLFRLGRLEFELTPSLWALKTEFGEIHPGDPIISVHIPQGEPLSPAACQDSFAQAESFWDKPYPYLCHSWLLYPKLQEILKPSAHIIAFQKLFTCLQVDYDTPEAEERIFGKAESDPMRYAEHTSLQRAAKKYLLSGKPLGNGLGILNRSKA